MNMLRSFVRTKLLYEKLTKKSRLSPTPKSSHSACNHLPKCHPKSDTKTVHAFQPSSKENSPALQCSVRTVQNRARPQTSWKWSFQSSSRMPSKWLGKLQRWCSWLKPLSYFRYLYQIVLPFPLVHHNYTPKRAKLQ